MNRQQDEQNFSELTPQIVTMMTTEHDNLQSGRSTALSDANGRSSLFIGAVSSGLIAIAFIGQISQLRTAFFMFSLVLFASLIFMGLVTFEHVLQCNIEDIIYARGINRIRHLYLEHAPQMQSYFVLSAYDNQGAPLGVHRSWREVFFTTAGMVAVITSVLVGVFVSLLLSGLFNLPLLACTSAGIAAFLVSVAGHYRYQYRHWKRLQRDLPAQFPSQPL